MYVGMKMLRHFAKVTPKTLVKDADRMLEESNLWMLLVMDGDRLVGYVRKEDISAALPSVMTTLEKHELNYLMSKLTVEKIVRKDIIKVSPETEIEVAAKIMHDKNLHGMAVVNGDGKVLGYINRSVMLEVLVEEMGLEQGGQRIAFEVEDRTGVIREVSAAIADMGLSIIATGTFYHDGRRVVVIRVATDDAAPVEAELKKRNYRLVTADDFASEWRS